MGLPRVVHDRVTFRFLNRKKNEKLVFGFEKWLPWLVWIEGGGSQGSPCLICPESAYSMFLFLSVGAGILFSYLTSFHFPLYIAKGFISNHLLIHPKTCSFLYDEHLVFPGGSVLTNPPTKQETRVWSLCWEVPLEKDMATHSSILAWEIPWTEEPGRLQSMGYKEKDKT